jgi:aminoglycoside phosphotransferase (APT) family kinase protein
VQNTGVLDLGTFARAERATGGFDTTVWHLERGSRQYALRVFRPGQGSTLERELVALRAAAAAGVRVPRVYAAGTYEQRPALLMDWAKGRPLLDQLRRRPTQVLGLGRAFGRLHAEIHRVPAPASLRANWIGWAGPLEPGFNAHLEQLTAASPKRLLHLDYHPLNVLVHDQQVSTVLDWTNAHAGDPRADFARTVTILRLSPPRGGAVERLGRLLLEIGYRIGYGPLGPDITPFYVWAALAMQHDLAKRFSTVELAHIQRWIDAWRQRLPD